MKIGRTQSQGEPFHFFRIKDLHFFRHLLWHYDLSLVKDFLHNALLIIPIDPHAPQCLHSEYLYIPNEEARITIGEGPEITVVRAGHVLPENICEFTAHIGFTLYKISKQTVLILEKLYFLDLPLMNGMKSCEKLSFLEHCQVVELNFNSFVYRRGEEVEAVYYLLEGQMKMFKELGENVYEIASLEKGRMFGLFQVKSRMKQRQMYAKASLNNTKILKIPMKVLEKICQERQTTIESLLVQAKSEIYTMLPKATTSRKSIVQSGEGDSSKMANSSRIMLERRLKTFESSRMIKSSVIENLVYSKKMLYRVKELNERMQTCNNRANKLQSENLHAIRHFNDKWKYQKEKTKTDNTAITHRELKGKVKAPFKRLLKYPSVQRFLGMDSAHDEEDLKILLQVGEANR